MTKVRKGPGNMEAEVNDAEKMCHKGDEPCEGGYLREKGKEIELQFYFQ